MISFRKAGGITIRPDRSKILPGLGLIPDMKQLKLMAEFTAPNTSRQVYIRPNESISNW